MRFLRYKTLKSVMGSGRAGPGRAGPGREYSDFSLKYERTRSARCARSLVITIRQRSPNHVSTMYSNKKRVHTRIGTTNRPELPGGRHGMRHLARPDSTDSIRADSTQPERLDPIRL